MHADATVASIPTPPDRELMVGLPGWAELAERANSAGDTYQ
ncbi:MAG: hypothetical protein AB3N07_01265 [Ruegeria sp.]